MRPTTATTGAVASLILAGFAVHAARADDLKKFLDQAASGNVMLKHELKLREEQGGIAPGLAGTVWTIKPDGHWQMTYFRTVDGKEQTLPAPRRQGILSQEQLTRIAEVLAEQNFHAIPERLGPDPEPGAGVNPHRYILDFGDKSVKLQGVGRRRGGDIVKNIQSVPAPDKDQAVHLDQFSKVAHQVVSQTTPG